MSWLHVFDMDGTLLRATTASLEIARHLGCLADLLRLEQKFAAGVLDTKGFAAEIYRLWGELTSRQVADAFSAAPWIDGLSDVLADIRKRGEHSLVVTMSPDFFADLLTGVGVDKVVASKFPALPFTSEPDPSSILSPADKITAVDRALIGLGLGRERCVAYGDSASDFPLFKALRYTVAINANVRLQRIALLRYDGDDLRDAYELARARCDVVPLSRDGHATQRERG
ncbi:MAG: hydrolase [Methylocystaceae bacterium]|nr:MAG: hydrolase [Methylocystaceae bacterium]